MVYIILLLPSLELCYVYLLSFQAMWSADFIHSKFILLSLTATHPWLPRNLFQVDILDVLFHLFIHMIDVSWASNIFAKHFVGNTVVSKIHQVPAVVQMRIHQRWLQMSKRNTDVKRGTEDVNRVTEHILELTVGQCG